MDRLEVRSGTEERPPYAAPAITTLTEDQVLDEVGPAQAYTGQVPFGF